MSSLFPYFLFFSELLLLSIKIENVQIKSDTIMGLSQLSTELQVCQKMTNQAQIVILMGQLPMVSCVLVYFSCPLKGPTHVYETLHSVCSSLTVCFNLPYFAYFCHILLFGKYQNEQVKHVGIHTAGFKPVLDRSFEYLI